MKTKAIFNWSGGKDSTLALYDVRQEEKFDIVSLMTTISSGAQRITMHGVRRELLLEQCKSIGLPVREVELPEQPSMKAYDEIMLKEMKAFAEKGVTHSIFGDIFLEDLRAYREEKLKEAGLKGCFPLWRKDTDKLVREFINLGFKAIVVCVNAGLLDREHVGRPLDRDFLTNLPKDVDPCGENGEFHTFVYDGPIFSAPVSFKTGERVTKEYPAPTNDTSSSVSESVKPVGFHFCDLFLA